MQELGYPDDVVIQDINNRPYMEILCLNDRRIRHFPEWVLEYKELIILNLVNNGMLNIKPEINQLFNLCIINISNNNIDKLPPEICTLINLKQFNASNNNLLGLPSKFGKLVNLEKLELRHNMIKKLPVSISNLISLKLMDLSYNKIVQFPAQLSELASIEVLDVSFNRLKALPRMVGNLKKLKVLLCMDNKIKELPESFYELSKLNTLKIDNNRITFIPVYLARMPYLQILSITGNTIIYIPPQITRLLRKQQEIGVSVYNDAQNIHNHNIQESLIKSIENIMQVPNNLNNGNLEIVIKEITENSILTINAKRLLFEYLEDECIHTILKIKFEDLFLAVWNMIKILENESKVGNDILERLNQEMQDSECKCFTGRITRLVNILSGFTPFVSLEISKNEQIANIIISIKSKMVSDNSYTVEKHKELVKLAMLERQYSNYIIEDWLLGIE
jgi:Leucine-rich repeat (LRR) protein